MRRIILLVGLAPFLSVHSLAQTVTIRGAGLIGKNFSIFPVPRLCFPSGRLFSRIDGGQNTPPVHDRKMIEEMQ